MCAVLQDVWLDQEDAQVLKEGEEVTLMDWGNAVVQVRRPNLPVFLI